LQAASGATIVLLATILFFAAMAFARRRRPLPGAPRPW
jgi:hypothetical protein